MRLLKAKWNKWWLHNLPQRCCCTACLREARRRHANARRRVQYYEIACISCGEMFVPTKSTALTCSNACRQREFRRGDAVQVEPALWLVET
jgi:hypothetical protein